MFLFIYCNPGVQGILWFLCWLYFGCEEPSDHPNITKAELEHIGQHWKTKVRIVYIVLWVRHCTTKVSVKRDQSYNKLLRSTIN